MHSSTTIWESPTGREGLPPRTELAQRYGERTGRNVDVIPYYTVLRLFKVASSLEGHQTRYKQVGGDNPGSANLKHDVPGCIRYVESVMRSA